MKTLLENCSKEPERWKSLRRGKITGTMAYDAADIDDGSSPIRAYLQLGGNLPEPTENEPMYFGKKLQSKVAEIFCEKYVEDHPGAVVNLKEADNFVQHETIPFVAATLDFEVTINGERCILETKTTNERNLELWDDGRIPNRARAQGLHQLGIARSDGVSRCFLAALIFKPTFRYGVIEANDALIAELYAREAKLFDCYDRSDPPGVKNATQEELTQLFFNNDGIDLTCLYPEDKLSVLSKFKEVSEAAKKIEEEKRSLSRQILEICGAASKAVCGKWSVTIVRNSGYESIDLKAFEKEDPSLFGNVFDRFKKKTNPYMYPIVRPPKE